MRIELTNGATIIIELTNGATIIIKTKEDITLARELMNTKTEHKPAIIKSMITKEIIQKHNKHHKKWTGEEYREIREIYTIPDYKRRYKAIKKLSKKYGRTIGSIRVKATHLKLLN